ncbi:MAG TPA: hypothetical protein VN226_06415 [Anaerolineales bacterium]|nr:hypothetical protein [Anaerolineales bacterium]
MTDFLRAINSGAQVGSVARVLANGKNNEGQGYLVTLIDTVKMTEQEYYLPFSEETQQFLGV